MKVKIKLCILGHLPHLSEILKIEKWNSSIFEITGVNSLNFAGCSDGPNWEFLDNNIEKELPPNADADILIVVTNVPLQDDYFVRRFSDNRICITYSGMSDILIFNDIPLKNLLLRLLYSATLVYKSQGNRIPLLSEIKFTHDDPRGCIFDMNGADKKDIVYSTNKPEICNSCVDSLINNHVANNSVDEALIIETQKELKRINKGLYFKITDRIKKHPIITIVISSLVALSIDLISHFIYEYIK
jgi:hypothetical protein